MEDLSSQLSDSDKLVLDRLCERGEAWVVGGWVRDSLAGKTPSEMDIATTLTPQVVSEIFEKTIPVGAAFGTILVLDEKSEKSWEVTTLRSDGSYGDGRRPDQVKFGDDIYQDLARRDFTINAMAWEPNTGQIIDKDSAGQNDLKLGIVRAVGLPEERITEDGLRILRAFRFLDAGDLGARRLEADLQSAIIDNLQMLDLVSSERKWAELSKIFVGQRRKEIIQLMDDCNVLNRLIKNTKFTLNRQFSGIPSVDLAVLCSEDERTGIELANHLKEQLKLSNLEASTIHFLHDLKLTDLRLEITSLRRFNSALSESMKNEVMQYFGEQAIEFIDAASQIGPLSMGNKPMVDGEYLMKITGLEAGIRLGRLKGWLHRRQIEENLQSTEQVIALLDTLDWENGEPTSWPSLSWP